MDKEKKQERREIFLLSPLPGLSGAQAIRPRTSYLTMSLRMAVVCSVAMRTK